MNILVIDDEWKKRGPTYKNLERLDPAGHITVEFLEAFDQLPDKLASTHYDAYIVDLVYSGDWAGVTLEEVMSELSERGPVALVSSRWDETNFPDLRRVWDKQNILLAFQWKELEDSYGAQVLAFHLKKVLHRWYHLEDLHLRPSDPVWILHISDLQFGGFEKERLLHESAIMADRVKETCKGGPTFIALTGDVVERGLPQEYDSAADWLGRLIQDFHDFTIPSSRILLVPGNHDVCVPLAGSGRIKLNEATKKLELIEEKADYFDALSSFAFTPFRQFASRVTADHRWVEKHDDYWLTTRFKHEGLVFFGCNTAAPIAVNGLAGRCLSMDVSGYVRQAIGRELSNEERRKLVMIGLVHHSPIAEDGDRAITNSDDFRTFCRGLETPLIVLHGHVHRQSCNEHRSAGEQIVKISAATPTKNASGRPADSLRGFNLLKLNRDKAIVTGMEYSAWKWDTGRLMAGPTEKFERRANGFWQRLH